MDSEISFRLSAVV